MSRTFLRVILACTSLLLSLALAEVGLRIAGPLLFSDSPEVNDPLLGWSLLPNFSGWEVEENDVWFTTNSAGFRDIERSKTRTPGTLRVALIGDSYVHGYYTELDKTLGAYLERNLSGCAPTSVEVLNFGVAAYNTAQELLLFEHRVAEYQPDVVVLAFFTYNDITENNPAISKRLSPFFVFRDNQLVVDNSFLGKWPRSSRWPLARNSFEWLRLHSRAVHFLSDRVGQWQMGPEQDQAPDDVPEIAIYSAPVDANTSEAWHITEALLSKFAAEVKSTGAEFWVATLANSVQVDPDLRNREALRRRIKMEHLFYPDRRIAAYGRTHGFGVVSLAEPLADYAAMSGNYLNGGIKLPPGQGHWNALANRLAAELTTEALCASSPRLAARTTDKR